MLYLHSRYVRNAGAGFESDGDVMAENSGIEWTDAWNPVSGCTRVSPGCDHCYAVTMTNRLEAMGQSKYTGLTVLNPRGDRHFNGQVRTHDDALAIPLKWKKPRKVFVNSMSDLFHKDVPFWFVDEVFAIMAITPHHTYQVLTKRPERMAEYMPGIGHRIYQVVTRWLDDGAPGCLGRAWDAVHELAGKSCTGSIVDFTAWNTPLPNVWLGTSVENQEAADKRIPHLLKVPAAVRFLSVEPLLGLVDLTRWIGGVCDCGKFEHGRHHMDCPSQVKKCGIGWCIVGCESGSKAREMKIEWAQSLAAQCLNAGVSFFMKQMMAGGKLCGELHEFPESLRIRQMPGEGK